MKKFVLIDGNALVHRCYHAVPKTLTAPDGSPTNAVYGFTSILLGILEVEHPEYLAVAFDMKGPTFRDAMYTEYKATRSKTDDDLIVQFPRVREVLEALSVPIFEKEGLEADDYLGIVSEEIEKHCPDVATLIVTGDKDAFQLVRGNTIVVTPVSGYTKVVRYDRQAVKDKMGVWPEQVPDFKGLCGDHSDNIPGVMGIGEKTAIRLLEEWGTVENLYAHLEEVQPERIRELLRVEKDKASLYKKVATILLEDGLDFDLDACQVHSFDMDRARCVFSGFSFKTLLGRLERLNKPWEQRRTEDTQVSLF